MAYIRKTRDEWEIWGDYGQGWEYCTGADNYKEARTLLFQYREEMPKYPHNLVKRRVKLAEGANG